jgi:hypothetical protein
MIVVTFAVVAAVRIGGVPVVGTYVRDVAAALVVALVVVERALRSVATRRNKHETEPQLHARTPHQTYVRSYLAGPLHKPTQKHPHHSVPRPVIPHTKYVRTYVSYRHIPFELQRSLCRIHFGIAWLPRAVSILRATAP